MYIADPGPQDPLSPGYFRLPKGVVKWYFSLVPPVCVSIRPSLDFGSGNHPEEAVKVHLSHGAPTPLPSPRQTSRHHELLVFLTSYSGRGSLWPCRVVK